MKRVVISEKLFNKARVLSIHIGGLWSNGPGWVRCASLEVEESRECVWGRWSPVKRVVISEKLFN